MFELRHNLTAYDAMYVALAETLDVHLLTDDATLAATPAHNADIHVYPDSTDDEQRQLRRPDHRPRPSAERDLSA